MDPAHCVGWEGKLGWHRVEYSLHTSRLYFLLSFLIFHTFHFSHSAFPTLLIFHTPRFPHSSFSTLLIFRTAHSALCIPSIPSRQSCPVNPATNPTKCHVTRTKSVLPVDDTHYCGYMYPFHLMTAGFYTLFFAITCTGNLHQLWHRQIHCCSPKHGITTVKVLEPVCNQ